MEPIPATRYSLNKARRILAVAVIIHVALFVLAVRGTLAALVERRPVKVGACVRGADGRGYYAWLRSPLIDGDFHFDNELAPLFAEVHGSEEAFPPTATGHTANHWPVGPALIWAPAVVAVHGCLRGLGEHSPWPADGDSAPYHLAVGGTTLALALLTLLLAYRMGRLFASPTAAAAAAAFVTLATPVVAFGTTEVSMAHGPATAALVLFVYYWLRTFGGTRASRWIALGGLLGLTSLMRWQLSTFALLPALEALWLAARAERWSDRVRLAIRLATAALASMVVFAPHLLAKQIVYGQPLGGLHQTEQNWLHPALWTVLGSMDRGLFYWTPITLPAIASLVYAAFRTRQAALLILAAGVAAQIWTVAAVLGEGVYLGSSFGFRLLTETCVLFAPGVALLLGKVSPRTARRLCVGGGLLAAWNLLLLGVYRHYLGLEHGGDPAAIFGSVTRYFFKRPLEGFAMLAAVGWLTYTLLVAFSNTRAAAVDAVPDASRNRRAA